MSGEKSEATADARSERVRFLVDYEICIYVYFQKIVTIYIYICIHLCNLCP